MFSNYHGDVVLPISAQGIPTPAWQPPARRGETSAPSPQEVPTLFHSATRDSKSGTVYLKIANRAAAPRSVSVEFTGLKAADPKGQAIALSAASSDDTNSIKAPTKIVPVASSVEGLGTAFNRTFPPYSVTVLLMKSR
jgi:alpha-N-arabinofuranosidase